MKSALLSVGIAVVMMCVAFQSCKKGDTDTVTAADPQLGFALQSDTPVFTFATTAGIATTTKPTFTWTAGTANITKFVLNASHGGVASEYVSSPLTNIDLFALSPSLSNITIPKGDFSGAKTTIYFTQTSAAPYPLVLLGTYVSASGKQIPVEFDMNDNLQVVVPVSNIIADGTKNFINDISLHLNQFLINTTSSQFENAAVTNGTIVISKTSNTALYTQLKNNMLICAAAALAITAK